MHAFAHRRPGTASGADPLAPTILIARRPNRPPPSTRAVPCHNPAPRSIY